MIITKYNAFGEHKNPCVLYIFPKMIQALDFLKKKDYYKIDVHVHVNKNQEVLYALYRCGFRNVGSKTAFNGF